MRDPHADPPDDDADDMDDVERHYEATDHEAGNGDTDPQPVSWGSYPSWGDMLSIYSRHLHSQRFLLANISNTRFNIDAPNLLDPHHLLDVFWLRVAPNKRYVYDAVGWHQRYWEEMSTTYCIKHGLDRDALHALLHKAVTGVDLDNGF